MKTLCCFALALLCAAPAHASVTVASPANGATVNSPFPVVASATACSTQPIAAMGYSFDDSPNTRIEFNTSFSASVTAPAGKHVLHVKSWGNQGASCTTNVQFSVVQASDITDLTVSQPRVGASVVSPFALAASGTLCHGQSIASLGYSLDDSSSTTMVAGHSIAANVSASAGSHTARVKAWGKHGAACESDVAIAVTAPHSGPTIPSNATATTLIQNRTNWTADHDSGTDGDSTGTTYLVATPAVSGSARRFETQYKHYGGERYNVELAADQRSTNFVYDVQMYIASPSNDIANIEMDVNQVMENGQTVIFGFQCDGWSNTWDYTANIGNPHKMKDRWLHSNQTCDPQQWTTDMWHHVQVQYSRDNTGYVTYQSVWLDGVEQDLNVTVLSAFDLKWGRSTNSNVQIDGLNSTHGSSTIYLDNMTLYSW